MLCGSVVVDAVSCKVGFVIYEGEWEIQVVWGKIEINGCVLLKFSIFVHYFM